MYTSNRQSPFFNNNLEEKITAFHSQIRKQKISQYQHNIRKKISSRNQIQSIIHSIPIHLQQALSWSKKFIYHFQYIQQSNNKQKPLFSLTKQWMLQLFQMVRKYPNLHTFKIFNASLQISNNQSIIQYLFIEDLPGFFLQVIIQPQDYIKRSLRQNQIQEQLILKDRLKIQSQIIKQVFCIFKNLFIKSVKARQSILNYKQFLLNINKCLNKYEDSIAVQYLSLIQAATRLKWRQNRSLQYQKIIHIIITCFCNCIKSANQIQNKQSQILINKKILKLSKSLQNLFKMNLDWLFNILKKKQIIQSINFSLNESLKTLLNFHQKINQNLQSQSSHLYDYKQVTNQLSNLDINLSLKSQNAMEIENLQNAYQYNDVKEKNQYIKKQQFTENYFLQSSCKCLISLQNLFIALTENIDSQIPLFQQIIINIIKIIRINKFNQSDKKINLNYKQFSYESYNKYLKVSQYQQARKLTYFLLSNLICTQQIKIQTKNTIIFDMNLIQILSQNVLIQNDQNTIHQLVYLFCSLLLHFYSENSSKNYHNQTIFNVNSINNKNQCQLQQSKQAFIFLLNFHRIIENISQRIISDDISIQTQILFFKNIKQLILKNEIPIQIQLDKKEYYNNILRMQGLLNAKAQLQSYAQSCKCFTQVQILIDQCYSLLLKNTINI